MKISVCSLDWVIHLGKKWGLKPPMKTFRFCLTKKVKVNAIVVDGLCIEFT